MADDDDLDRKVRKLTIEHAETRWLTLRLDDDVKEIRQELRAIRHVQGEHTALLRENSAELQGHSALLQEHSAVLQEHSEMLQAHTGRFDSVDAQLRSLTQLVGQVLDRLPDDPGP